MFCTNCGKEIPADSEFCPFCGIKISAQGFEIDREKKKEQQSVIKPSKKSIWKRRWVWAIIIFVVIAVVFTELPTDKFPPLEEPKTVTFKWEYKGSQYKIKETLYTTVYNYYRKKPDLFNDCWPIAPDKEDEKECLKLLLTIPEEDKTFSKIASEIKSLGEEKGLDEDQIIELTIAFVQSIPYDEGKLEAMIANPDLEYDVILEPRYPYEALYDNKGVCSGKTFLAAVLIRELDYGVAIFGFDYEGPIDHVGIGIKCPKSYSSYNSGYCFAETTEEGHIIGLISDLDPNTYLPAEIKELPFYEKTETAAKKESEIKLEDYEIYEIEDGKSYQGIVDTFESIKRMNKLDEEMDALDSEMKKIDSQLTSQEAELNILENELDVLDNEIDVLDNKMGRLHEEGDYDAYNSLVSKYNNLLEKRDQKYNFYYQKHKIYEQKIDEYNQKVDSYSKKVERYNKLLDKIFSTSFYLINRWI